MLFFVRSMSGLVIFVKLGMNALRYPTTPRKLQISFLFLRVCGHSIIPDVFAGSIDTPLADMHIPRKMISGALKINLLSLRCSSLSLQT